MRLGPTQLELSATDLSNFLGCRHRTALDMAVPHPKLRGPGQDMRELLKARNRARCAG